MSDKKQQETEQPRRQNKDWLWCKGIIMIVLGGFSLFICCLYLFPELICWLPLSPEQWVTNKHVWLKLYLGALATTGVVALCKPQIITSSSEKYFITRVLTTGITGGAFALLLPIAVKSTTTGVGGLRHSILLATGGLLAILTLGETRRKNDNDLKAANELQIRHKETLDQQKFQFKEQIKEQQQQFEANAFKERKAERRERYSKAIEQLGDEKSSVRMGGVYTLVGLVDEWLEEESIKEYEDRFKEGQVIINNLCAYIRSPFTLASHYDELSQDSPTPEGIYKDKKEKFYADKATLDSETDVRLSIIKEIHDCIQGPDKNTPGAWSDFEYDFSGSTFFYHVDLTKSYYKKPVNFSGSTYQGEADFRESTYKKNVIFSTFASRSAYEGEAYFSGSTYQGEADFRESTYKKNVIFSTFASRSAYEGEAGFSNSTYQGEADFSNSTYQGEADFGESTYEKNVIFSTFASRSTYKGGAYFSGSTYQGKAYFSDSTYQGEAYFSGSTYQGEADFSRSTYTGWAYFSRSIFYNETYFGNDKYSNRSSCFTNRAPQFYDKKNRTNTLFGSHNNDFTVDIDKGYPIDLDSEGIPLNCKFLTSEQKEYLADKFQEIEKTNNKLLEVKDPREKAELSKNLQALTEELHEWREEVTTVNVEDVAAEDTES